jgi:RNA polymerase sigma-70 factor (ECF subfamily)
MTEAELIIGCKRFNKDAQKEVYNRFAPKLKSVCQRYANEKFSADDILQEGFVKIFSNINKFNGSGSFEGWMRRIVVNFSISLYRIKAKEPSFLELNNSSFQISDDTIENEEPSIFDILKEKLNKEDIIEEIQRLPEAYKLILNLYIFENYSHKEICNELNISVQNSKVRLMRARQLLQENLLSRLNIIKYEKNVLDPIVAENKRSSIYQKAI